MIYPKGAKATHWGKHKPSTNSAMTTDYAQAKERIEYLVHNIPKNQLKMDQQPKCKS